MRRIVARIPSISVQASTLQSLDKLGFVWGSGVRTHDYNPNKNNSGEFMLIINLAKKTLQYDNREFQTIEDVHKYYPDIDTVVVSVIPSEIQI